MNCPKCKHEIPQSASFCPECGSVAAGPQENSEGAISSETPNLDNSTITAIPSDSQSEFSSANTTVNSTGGGGVTPSSKPNMQSSINVFSTLNKQARYSIIAGSAVVVIILIAVIGSTLFGGISVDIARQAFENQSSLATKGAVSSTYTDATTYEITEFNIESEEAVELTSAESALSSMLYGTDTIRAVTCSGKVTNESFETEFIAVVYVGKVDNEWVALDSASADIVSTTTIPLKGVDSMGISSNSDATYSNFSSTLEESNGTYTSSATMTETYNFWFGTDTAQVSQEFTFDPDSGWQAVDSILRNDTSTTFNIEGYVLQATGVNDMVTSTITLHDADDENMSADYSIVATIPEDRTAWYKDFTSEGTAVVTIVHDYGKESITLTIEDEENGVSFNGSISSLSSATYRASVITNDKWYTGIFASDSYDITFDQTLTYTLSKASSS